MLRISPRSLALLAGWSIVLMALLAGFAHGYVFSTLFVPDNAPATVEQLHLSETLFRAGILAFWVVLLCDVAVSGALYLFLKPVGQRLSLWSAGLRLVYTAMLGAALMHLNAIVPLLHTQTPTVAGPGEPMLRLFEQFSRGWSAGLIVFGAHLLALGVLVYRARFVPPVWGWLLGLAGICYLGTNLANLLWDAYPRYKPTVEGILSLPMIVGELGFGIWLLARGGKPTQV
ncbi:DUF4386 family protein [Rudanella paleaurantiibacter]|uniref:DUF4386 family protein n=1 Tax=Rudanella paleaurantiibacter TaxID=2614655 RepID=A0A7J5U484_9BACT|nr:DUF4386 domain-containing protein [Rudanella paleaurantiibacter]KAB7731845.1 DUF4386 family protein [Rudanella paleaurantiibacter]